MGSVVNVTAGFNDFRLNSLDSNRVSREEMCLPSPEVVNYWLKYWGRYLRVVKCVCLVLSLGR